MKKILLLLLAIVTVLTPVLATAADSPQNKDIPETKVIDVIPENEDEPVVPPTVDIVKDTEPVIELQEEMQTLYRLIINYVYVDGSTAAPTYDVMLQQGTPYDVTSPVIAGFTASMLRVAGIMPARNVQVTVVYLSETESIEVFDFTKMKELFGLDGYETPLGLGFSILNLGICIE